MKIDVSYSDYSQLLAEFQQNNWVSSYRKGLYTQNSWHSPFMVGRSRFFNLAPDLKIHDWIHTYTEDWEVVERGSQPMPVVVVFLMQGCLQGTYRNSSYLHKISVEAGNNLLMCTGQTKQNTWYCPQSLYSKTVEVVVEAKRLVAYLSQSHLEHSHLEHSHPEHNEQSNHASTLSTLQKVLTQRLEQPYFHSGVTTPAMQMVLHQYLHCPYEGAMQQMYLESKAVELIALKLSQIQQMTTQTSVFDQRKQRSLKSKDINRIHYAREILLRDMANPPSLQQLAEQVGIGDYKLKQDFRRTFGTTVFGYLRSHRLECARQLLIEQQMNVSEAACFVGYSSLSKFTAAFKRQFGILPSACSSSKESP